MIRARLFHADRQPAAADIADWPALCQDDENLLWIDLENAEDEEVGRVAELLAVDARAVALGLEVNRRPLVRVYSNHYLVTVIAVDVDERPNVPRIRVVEIDLFVGRNFLVSLHKRPLPFATELEERTGTNPHLGRFDSAYLLFIFLDTFVAHLARQLEEVEDEVERLEERLLRERGRAALEYAFLMRRHVNTLRRLISPHREAFAHLVAADSPVTEQHVEIYFRDLLAHFNTLAEHLDHQRDVLAGIYNLYLSNISYRTNREVRVLTFLSAILLPMTVITGMFGTNFKLVEYETWQGFYVMLAALAGIAAGMLLYFRFRG